MSSRVEFPCPHTGEHCQQGSCPQTACLYDLDEAVWPDVEPDPQSLANEPPPQLPLYDELCGTTRTLGRPGPERSLCNADREQIALWAEHGIPADLSTVEHACELLMLLWQERATWLALVDDLLDGDPKEMQ